MTTPASPQAAPATPALSPAASKDARTPLDALSAAVTAIAIHITGRSPESGHEALTVLGLTPEDAELITAR